MNKEKQLRVIYTKWGLANFFGDVIEINECFKNNKKLRDYVVKHELSHSKNFDLFHDMKTSHPKILFSLILFILKHPRTWIDFLPIQIRKGKVVYDSNLVILYFMVIILLIILWKILSFIL